MNFVENCKIYSKEVLVNDINRMINTDKLSRSYNDLYFGTQGMFKHTSGFSTLNCVWVVRSSRRV